MTDQQRKQISERMRLNNPNKDGSISKGRPNPKASERMKIKNPRLTCKDVWSKDIYQYDLDGNFIKYWEKRSDVRKILGIKIGDLKGKKSTGGFLWREKFEGNTILPYSKKEKVRVISLYNKDGTKEKTFNSVKQCRIFLECKCSSVINSLRTGGFCRGFYIRDGTEDKITVFEKTKNRYVPLLSNSQITNLVGNFEVEDGEYYLYRHIRPDKNEVFYIGIGKKVNYKYSIKCYSNDYKRAFTKGKRNKIWNDIVNKNNGVYQVEIVMESNNYAFIKKKEIEFIALYGQKNNGSGTLSNLTKGGEGTVGFYNSNLPKTAKTTFVYDAITKLYIKSCVSTQSAAREFNVKGSKVRSNVIGKTKKADGYIFTYFYQGEQLKQHY